MTQASANSVSKSTNFARGGDQFSNNNRGRSRGRRGGRYYNQRLICQLCGKTSHFSTIYYYRFYQSFVENFGKQNQQGQQSVSTNFNSMEGNFVQQKQLEYHLL
ncbi:hypothetical protein ACOSQ3_014788 [Xanthoceras sorbifolium]